MKIRGSTLCPKRDDNRNNFQASVFTCFASLALRPVQRKWLSIQIILLDGWDPRGEPCHIYLPTAQSDSLKSAAENESCLPAQVLEATHCCNRTLRRAFGYQRSV
jgi:hypothetical protein